jgi:hypothetical protein
VRVGADGHRHAVADRGSNLGWIRPARPDAGHHQALHVWQQAIEYPPPLLVAHDREDEGRGTAREEGRQLPCQRRGAGRVVRAVEQDERRVPHDRQPSRPDRRFEPAPYGLVVAGKAVTERRDREQRHLGVRALKRARNPEPQVGPGHRRASECENAGRLDQLPVVTGPQHRRTHRRRARQHDALRLGSESPQCHRHAWLEDSGLLARHLGDGPSEVFLVVERDVCDGRHRRPDHVGRVEPPAEPHLDHADVDADAAEPFERHQRHELEVREGDSRPGEVGPEVVHQRNHDVARDRPPVHADALGEVDEMGRRVETRAIPSGAQDRLDHRRGRPFAVRARDVHGGPRALGMATEGDGRPHPLELQVPARGHLEARQVVEAAAICVHGRGLYMRG